MLRRSNVARISHVDVRLMGPLQPSPSRGQLAGRIDGLCGAWTAEIFADLVIVQLPVINPDETNRTIEDSIIGIGDIRSESRDTLDF